MKQSIAKRRTKSEGLALIKAFHKSGLKTSQFCTQKKIPYCVFKYWLNVAKNETEAAHQKLDFLPVKITREQSINQFCISTPLKVCFTSGISIEIPTGFDLPTFKRVLKVFQKFG